MDPIRIAHVIGKLNVGGVKAVINNYYRNINHNNLQFDFYIDADSNCKPSQELIEMGARYFVVPPYQKLPQYIAELTRLFKENSYRIVHANVNTLSVFALYAAKKAGVPIRINHNHSTAGKGETKKNLLKYALRPFAKMYATDLAACSEYAGKWLFGKHADFTVFNNAIKPEKFQFDERTRAAYRRRFGLEGRFVIGHVGRFCYQKNHEFLIEIFLELKKREPDAVLMLVGAGDLQSRIKKQVRKYRLSDSVLFLGARTDVAKLYQAMDVFVLPSWYEGLPIVGVEAQAAGLPCVLSQAMTKEVLISDSASMRSLDDPPARWAETVLSYRHFPRKKDLTSIRNAGFDIRKESKKLEEFYCRKLRELR